MDFHLECIPAPIAHKIHHRHSLMLMGSCFTENIGNKLLAHQFKVLQNPNGILFNPVSVKLAINSYIKKETISEKDIFRLNEAWHSWNHHSRFSSITPDESIIKINQAISAANDYLRTADFLVITLGSAWVYELTEKAPGYTKGKVAANNHKAPADWFNRRLLDYSETIVLLQELVQSLQDFNPGLQIIFTISPVRHLREGFVENNRSKALLISAVHQMGALYDQCHYFPAYELVIDDLRDYRFYAEDMVHPNYAATNYVWDKFVMACMDENTRLLMKEINEINAAMRHRPFHEQSAAHQAFKSKYLNICMAMQQKHSFLHLDEQINYFSS